MAEKLPEYQLEVRLPDSEDGQIRTQVVRLKGTNQIIFKNKAEFPEIGDSEHLYFALDEDAIYIWRDNHYHLLVNEDIYNLATTSQYGRVKLSNGDIATLKYEDGIAAGLDHYHSNYIPYKDWLMTTNPFCQKHLYISKIDNAFYAAQKRWNVSAINNNTQEEYSVSSISRIFDGSYETILKIPAGQSVTIHFDFKNDPEKRFPGYPYGLVFVSFYYTFKPASVSGRMYCNFESHGVGWHDMPVTIPVNQTSQCVYQLRQAWYNMLEMELTITAPEDKDARITQIEMNLDRPSPYRQPVLSKYTEEELYYDLTAPCFKGHLKDINAVSKATTIDNFTTFDVDGALKKRAITDVVEDLHEKGLAKKSDLDGLQELKFHNRMNFPHTGDKRYLYISVDENKIYRWNESKSIYSVVGSDYNDIELIDCGGAK